MKKIQVKIIYPGVDYKDRLEVRLNEELMKMHEENIEVTNVQWIFYQESTGNNNEKAMITYAVNLKHNK